MCAVPVNAGLSELITVVVCVLLLGPCGMSAPTGKPIWVDPCGGLDSGIAGANERRSNDDILDAIIITARNALSYAQEFSHDYVQRTMNEDMSSVLKSWPSRFGWLPSEREVPKELGQKTPDHHLSSLAKEKLEMSLINSYRYLQTIAVGLEQAHLDKSRNNDEFVEEFATIQHKLKQVLCEVQSALSELMPDLRIVDVQRSIMPEEDRRTDESYRRIRDWFIFRDFMNCLEYVIEVCEFFKSD